ncbi:MAG: sucrase ferredoxin [Acidimicrobiales bacterium]|nr:sucrase ferredoxin [Actinomycetota bacterium]
MLEPRCAGISRARAEPVRASASMVRGWVMLEQPGPWGSEAVAQSRLPDPVAGPLQELGRVHGLRVLLLRRPERPAVTDPHCFVAYSGRPSPWIEKRVLSDPHQLLDLDLSGLATGRRLPPSPAREAELSEPLYLVCTNGRHDPCCAQLGRPVVRALLDGSTGDRVWECSHIGGDRFAGNLVCLPHGLYFGRLGPVEAAAVVASYERGLIELDHYRGRAGDPFAVQAAEFFVRESEGLLGVDDLVPERRRRMDDGVVEVSFRGPRERRFIVKLAANPADEPRPLTCAAVRQQRPATYSLLGLRTG